MGRKKVKWRKEGREKKNKSLIVNNQGRSTNNYKCLADNDCLRSYCCRSITAVVDASGQWPTIVYGQLIMLATIIMFKAVRSQRSQWLRQLACESWPMMITVVDQQRSLMMSIEVGWWPSPKTIWRLISDNHNGQSLLTITMVDHNSHRRPSQ